MAPKKPPQNPYYAPYVSPKELAETRARWRRIFYGTAAALAVLLALMLFGYTDQAPAWLRALTANVDAEFGFPVLRLIAMFAA